jgi:hypothetical protein
MIPANEGAKIRTAAVPQPNPVLLALPPRRTENRHGAPQASVDPCLEQLQVIETGCGPRVEAALLKDLLTRSPGLGPTLADPFEVHNYHNPLAALNAYKHRLHALRCEFVNVRLRLHELETQLNQSNYHRQVLEKHVQFLDATLTQMQASRAWKLTEKCSRWHRLLSQWLGRIFAVVRGQASGTR